MLVFFIDSNENDFGSGSNIGNLYMNRFIIDEDACHEIVKRMTHGNFFFIKKFYLRVAYLMIHNQMSHNQAKNWVLSLIYRAAIDFKKSKKN